MKKTHEVEKKDKRAKKNRVDSNKRWRLAADWLVKQQQQ